MDPSISIVSEVIHYRGIERIIVAIGSVVMIVLGGLLYKWGILDKTDMKVAGGKLGFGIALRNASPGVLFCLFGFLAFYWSLSRQVIVEQEAKDLGKSIKQVNENIKVTYDEEKVAGVNDFLDKVTATDSPPSKEQFDNMKSEANALREARKKAKEGSK